MSICMRRPILSAALLLAVLATLAVTAMPEASGPTGPRLAGCPVFPANNAWNRDVSKDPVDPRSARYLSTMGIDDTLHADFGGNGQYGIPIAIASRTQRKVPVRFVDYPEESDPGPYPIPPSARIEGGENADGDRHVLVVQRGTCRLYELFNARRGRNSWTASNGAVFNLRSNRLRRLGITSADAAGLPITPGLARIGEVRAGAIRHALRVTFRRTQRGFVRPATHFASRDTDPSLPPMGLRLRLKASFPLAGYRGQALVILKALKKYGLFVADNGSDWYITGESHRGWDDDDLNQLKRVPGSAFEVVRHGRIDRITG